MKKNITNEKELNKFWEATKKKYKLCKDTKEMIEYNTTAGDPKKFDRNFGFCWSVFSILFIL
ncbi:MAG: hypothetical protein WCI00_02585 [bacterium]